MTNLGVLGPTRYRVPDASARECSSLPHSSPSARMHPTLTCALPESPHCPPSPPEWDPGHQRPHDAAPTAEGGGCRAWQTVWFPRESPVTQNDFNWEQVCPAGPGVGAGAGPPREEPAATLTCSGPLPADYQPPSPPACPAFSFGGRLTPAPPTEARAHLGMLQAWGAGPWAQPLLQVPLPTGLAPSPTTSFPGAACQAPARPLSA